MRTPLAAFARLGLSATLAASLAASLACGGGGDRTARPDSAAGTVAGAGVTPAPHERFASDATLVIQATPALQVLLRAVSDSFATREAIGVVFSPPPEGPLGISPAADLVVVSGELLPRLLVDSASWALPFGETPPDSVEVARADSARRDSIWRADSARISTQNPRGRGMSRRQADSLRRDGSGRALVFEVGKMIDSIRSDSVRTLVLTVPSQAPNSAVAERFVRYLLTDGRAALLRSGVHVLPRLAVRGFDPPPGLLSVVDTVIAPEREDPNAARFRHDRDYLIPPPMPPPR